MEKSLSNPIVLLDTNIYLSALIKPTSCPGKVVGYCTNKPIQLIVPRLQIIELNEVAKRSKIIIKYQIDKAQVNQFIDSVITIGNVVEDSTIPKHKRLVKSRDPKDNMLLDTAIVQKVNFLITGDEDLLILNGSEGLGPMKILTPAEFLRQLKYDK